MKSGELVKSVGLIKSEAVELLDARPGLLKYKFTLMRDLVALAFSLCVYFFIFNPWFFQLVVVLDLWLAAAHYRAAKRHVAKQQLQNKESFLCVE